MPDITTIRVMRMRKVQPEQFGSAGAEVEMFATVREGENPMDAARDMLNQTRALVYENLGMKLPEAAKTALAEMAARDTADDLVAVTVETDAIPEAPPATEPKKRGRPKGSTNTRPKAGTPAADAHLAGNAADEKVPVADASLPADETPTEPTHDPSEPPDPSMPADDEVPNISTGEARVGPDDDAADHGAEMPPEATDNAEDLAPWEGETKNNVHKLYTALDLQNDLRKACPSDNDSGTITVQQGRQIMAAFKVTRTRDLTPEQVKQAKKMLDDMIAAKTK